MLEYGQALRDKVLVCMYHNRPTTTNRLTSGLIVELLGEEKNEVNARVIDRALKHLNGKGYLDAHDSQSDSADDVMVMGLTSYGEDAAEKLIAQGLV